MSTLYANTTSFYTSTAFSVLRGPTLLVLRDCSYLVTLWILSQGKTTGMLETHWPLMGLTARLALTAQPLAYTAMLHGVDWTGCTRHVYQMIVIR